MSDKILLSQSYVDETMEELITDLQLLIRQPSISALHQGLEECALILSKMMEKAGVRTELLYLDDKREDYRIFKDDYLDPGSPSSVSVSASDFTSPLPPPAPIVFGEVKSKSNPNGKTILFYNHYDVQPIDPIEKWDEDPFSGKVDGNVIFGRGSSDDKGELITRIKAVEFFLNKTHDVPCNIKFLIEGEEEIGSPNLNRYLIKTGY